MIGINSIHHVAVIASDYEKSKHFYSVILGLRILAENYRPSRKSWKLDMALPGYGQIELFSFPSPPKRPSHPEASGLRHLALSVSDLAASVIALNAKGIPTEDIRIDEFTNMKFVFFANPDGLPIELYESERNL
jgi:glyoxylase I family protein